jgi:3,4-dihydroxy 2-butanone 4-phosphate synthase / GTP cyclohydrolase II
MFSEIPKAIEEFHKGNFVIIVDDEDRENEGDLVIAAEHATPEKINFMIKHAKGLVCLPIIGERLDELNISPMVNQKDNTECTKCNFTVSIDHKHNTSSGISAHDRAATIKAVLDKTNHSDDFSKPGHIFPLRYEKGGVLKRAGHTEASVDLAMLANLYPAAVICEIIKEDGTMARVPDLTEYAKTHGLAIITIKDLIQYRLRDVSNVTMAAQSTLPTKWGDFRIVVYKNTIDDKEHLVLVKGDVNNMEDVIVRVHSECLTGDVFGSQRCDCGEQLNKAMKIISDEGKGVILYMRQEGRGIGLTNKIKAYTLQDSGLDTVEANKKLGFRDDLRDYGIGAQILKDLGLTTIKILTNNPRKIVGIDGHGLRVVQRVPLTTEPNLENKDYLQTKKIKMDHILDLVLTDDDTNALSEAETDQTLGKTKKLPY